jgi:A1 cistron-splicing factor AAR2
MNDTTVHGASILLLDVPPQSLGGIDLLSFTTSPRFKGVKLLPPGVHFAFVSTSTSLSIRHGAWFRIKELGENDIQLVVRKWSDQNEELLAENDEMEILKHRANLGAIWRESLTPYRQSSGAQVSEEKNDWPLLTEYISDTVLGRITSSKSNWSLTSASSAAEDLDDIPGLPESKEYQKEKELRFLPVDLKQTWRPGATGRERTDGARDTSWALGELISEFCSDDENELLGEMQFCFLMVLTLNNYSCLEQWKRLLGLLFTSKAAVISRSTLFVKAIKTLRLQLSHCEDVEGGLFDLTDDGAGHLKNLLRKFKKSLSDVEGKGKDMVLKELDDLEEYLREAYQWNIDDNFVRRGMVTLEDGEQVEVAMTAFDEEDEMGEFAPTVVELSKEQLEELEGTGNGVTSKHHEEVEDEDLEAMDARY